MKMENKLATEPETEQQETAMEQLQLQLAREKVQTENAEI